jgi:trehalose-6-phosphate synthase
MKLKTILEAKYEAPPSPPSTRMPEYLRTKHGLKQHLEDWADKVRDAIWHAWIAVWNKTEEELETFYMEIEGNQEVQKLMSQIPHEDVKPMYDNMLDEILARFMDDAREDIEYEQEGEDW